jgi:hypothetical protein
VFSLPLPPGQAGRKVLPSRLRGARDLSGQLAASLKNRAKRPWRGHMRAFLPDRAGLHSPRVADRWPSPPQIVRFAPPPCSCAAA